MRLAKDSCMLLRSFYVPVDIRLATVQTLEGMRVIMGPQPAAILRGGGAQGARAPSRDCNELLIMFT